MTPDARPRHRPFAAACCVLTLLVAGAAAGTSGAQTPPYRNPGLSFAERAADLVSRMTLEEKAGQLSTTNGPAIRRLGVQEYSYWNEAQHGVSAIAGDYSATNEGGGIFNAVAATSFPTNFSTSLSWDPSLVRREMAAVSREARGLLDPTLYNRSPNNLGPSAGNYGSLFYFNPTVNIGRDPRWGRNDEAFGEDPFLTGVLGGAHVDGMQGKSPRHRVRGRYLKAVATAKHFALNNVENDRTGISSNTDEATIRDYYTPHFRRLVEDAGVGGVMSSYNAVNGTPAVANSLLLNVLARRTWGHRGYVTSDCGGVATTYRNRDQPIGTPGSAVYFIGHDWAPPGWTTNSGGESALWTRRSDGRQISGQAGGEAFSLRAGNELNCGGDNGRPGEPPFGDTIMSVTGRENRIDYVREAIAAGVLSEGVIDRALVRVFTLRMRTGEFDPRSRQPYTRIGKSVIESASHRRLAQQVAEQSMVLLKNGRAGSASAPLLPADPRRLRRVVILGDQADKVFLGGYSGAPREQVSLRRGLTAALRRTSPNTTVTYDAAGSSSTASTPAVLSPATRAAIQAADLVVVMVGTDERTNFEGSDRSNVNMPGNYNSLVQRVAGVGNPRIALVVQAGAMVELGAVKNRVASILFSGPNGQRQGSAAANVLLGASNPSGHLSFTWYRGDSQLPSMSDYDITPARTGGLGRTYQFLTRTPEYAFGFGHAYTTFRWSKARLDRSRVDANGRVRVTVAIRNTGRRAGATVAQVYAVPPKAGRRRRPKRRLVGFAKTRVLAPGRSQRLAITVPVRETLRTFSPSKRRSVVITGRWRLEVSRWAGRAVRRLPLRISGRISRRVRHVTVQPPRLSLRVGQTLDLRATNRWLTGLGPSRTPAAASRIISAVRHDDSFLGLRRARIRFASNRPGVLRVSRAGRLRAIRAGVATIRVTVGGARGRTTFVVQGNR